MKDLEKNLDNKIESVENNKQFKRLFFASKIYAIYNFIKFVSSHIL